MKGCWGGGACFKWPMRLLCTTDAAAELAMPHKMCPIERDTARLEAASANAMQRNGPIRQGQFTWHMAHGTWHSRSQDVIAASPCSSCEIGPTCIDKSIKTLMLIYMNFICSIYATMGIFSYYNEEYKIVLVSNDL